jgi:hypothetical protein
MSVTSIFSWRKKFGSVVEIKMLDWLGILGTIDNAEWHMTPDGQALAVEKIGTFSCVKMSGFWHVKRRGFTIVMIRCQYALNSWKGKLIVSSFNDMVCKKQGCGTEQNTLNRHEYAMRWYWVFL